MVAAAPVSMEEVLAPSITIHSSHHLLPHQMLVLIASGVKAARVGARRRRLRELRAKRVIAAALRVRVARARVARLRKKHAAAAMALRALARLRMRQGARRPQPDHSGHRVRRDWGWSGLSLPNELSKLGAAGEGSWPSELSKLSEANAGG